MGICHALFYESELEEQLSLQRSSHVTLVTCSSAAIHACTNAQPNSTVACMES